MKKQTTFKLLKLGVVSNVFEWYEYIIYAYLAAILGQLFFNASSPIMGMMQAFSAFALANLMRPLGGYCFGKISDRISRRYSLMLSLYMMAVPTVLIGMLPTYDQIGLLAPLSLVVLRFMQGFAMGGEFPSSVCYIFENANPAHKNMLCSLLPASPTLGILCGSAVVSMLFGYFDQATIMAWAWRIPFLLGAPLALGIRYIRYTLDQVLALPETKAASESSNETTTSSLLSKENLITLLQSIFLMGFGYVLTAVCQVWMPAYLTQFLKYPSGTAQLINTLMLTSSFFFYFLTGYAAHFLGAKRILKYCIIVTILFIYPLFYLLQSKLHGAVLVIHLIFAWLIASHGGVIFRILGDLFAKSIRGQGIGIAWTLPAPIFGSITPMVCTYVIHKTGWLMFPAFYIMFFGLLALPVALRLKGPAKQKV